MAKVSIAALGRRSQVGAGQAPPATAAGSRRGWTLAVALGIACALCPVVACAAPASGGPVPPTLHARSAAVLDPRDGAVLWSEDGRRRLPMASTTKLMTALVSLSLEHQQTDVPMTVPPEIKQAYGEILYLRTGDQYTYLQLLEGMLLPSANDAAVAIAVDSAGSLPRFVALMNGAARAYGLRDTHFANPDGLNDPDHYSSADDLARLGWLAMGNPVIRSIVHLPSATIPWPDHGGSRLIGNINDLLAYFPGADGIKTGYTSEAMNVIVGSARRDGHAAIAVVMGEPASTFWRDEEHLLDFGLALTGARGAVATVVPASMEATPAPQIDATGPGQGSPRLRGGVAAGLVMSPGAAVATPQAPALAGPAPAPGGLIAATLIPAQVGAGAPADPVAAAAPWLGADPGDSGVARVRLGWPLAGLFGVVLLAGFGLSRRRRPARLAGASRPGRSRGGLRMD